MIIDAHAWIGHWPFRALPQRSAGDLLKQMDKHGIDKALVASLHSLFYADAQEANRELVAEIGKRRDRLVPCAVVNPIYIGWKEDLKQCREEWGMPVLRITPLYHQYDLSKAAPLVEAAHELKMTVAITERLVGDWTTHPLDPAQDANMGDTPAFLAKFPKASFLMLNYWDSPGGRRWDEPVCYLDFTRPAGGCGQKLAKQVEKYGADRIIFGTTMLMFSGHTALLAVEHTPLTKAQRERILWKNVVEAVPDLRE
jgi:uncharacterized protein